MSAMRLFAAKQLPSKFVAIKKIASGLLVIWVCGIGPLMYLESYSPHHIMRPYRLSIVDRPAQSPHLSPALAAMLARRQEWRWARWLSGRPQLVDTAIAVGGSGAQLLKSLVHDGALVAAPNALNVDNRFSGRALSTAPSGSSVALPPPEKPPPFSGG